jgi:hypothetical protein
MKQLRGPDSQFPVDVTSYDFSTAIGTAKTSFKFGLNTKLAIEAIRKLADGMERGEYVLQHAESSQEGTLDDFAMSSLTLRWALKHRAPELLEGNSVSDPAAENVSTSLAVDQEGTESNS